MKIKYKLVTKYLYFIGLFIFALSICFKSGIAPYNVNIFDSSSFIYIARLMQNGLTPYIDAFDHKGPLIYLINYIGLGFGGQIGIWFYEVISMFISILFCYKTGITLTNNRLISFITIFCSFSILYIYLEGGNLTEEYALPFISISLYIFIKYFVSNKLIIKSFELIVLGVSLGAVLMLRPNMIAIWIVYISTIIIKLLSEKQYKYLIVSLIYLLLGVLLVIIPFILYLLKNHAFSAFIEQYLIFNFKYSSANGLGSVLYAILVFSSTNLFKISLLIFILLILRAKKYNKIIIYSGFAFLIVNVLLITISGRIYNHYGMILIPGFIIPISYLFQQIRINVIAKYSIVVQVIILLVVVSTITNYQLINFVHSYREIATRVEQNKPGGKSELAQFIESNTTVDDLIIVFGIRADIYLESNRYSASKYFYQYPIGLVDEKIANEFIEDIKNYTPIIIVDSKNHFDKTDKMAVFLKQYTSHNYNKFNIDGLNVFLRMIK